MNWPRILTSLSGAPVGWLLLRDDGTAARRIHRLFVRNAWRERRLRRRLGMVLGLLALPVTAPPVALVCTWNLGPAVKKACGRGYVRQALDQILLAFTRCVPPLYYYVFELYKEPNRKRALEYIYRFETKLSLYRLLRSRLASRETIDALSNKQVFSERCARHGVPAIPVLGVLSKGVYQSTDPGEPGIPRQDLFVKPLRGKGGKGAERWRCEAGSYSGPEGQVLDPQQLAEHLEQISSAKDYVVRPWLRNDPALEDLCSGILSTVRILTCRNETGGFEITHACFKMARRPDAQVDNASAGAIAARVDLSTGELGAATNLGLSRDSGWWDRHPLSGAVIKGRTLSHWKEAARLALRAHEAFPDVVLVGWDIALLEEGAVLVEGNKGPGIDLMQRVQQEPLGSSRFGELMDFHLQRAWEGRERA